MNIPGMAAAGTVVGPWLVLVVVLGVGLAGLVTALLLRRGSIRSAPAEDRADDADDLARFLEFPPGTGTAAAPTGWAALAPATAADQPTPVPRARRDAVIVLTAMTLTTLLLFGIAAVVSSATGAGTRDGEHGRYGQRAGTAATRRGTPERVAARLTFGGVVLEPRAVGVTATYPAVEVSADGDRARARVEFPTFNCLSAAAPVDPVAAGCTRSVTEYAELRSPDVVVTPAGDGFRVTGRFPTEVRPNGSSPVPTGRVYELRITVTPADGTAPDGWRAADGVLELGSERADTVDGPGLNVLRSPS